MAIFNKIGQEFDQKMKIRAEIRAQVEAEREEEKLRREAERAERERLEAIRLAEEQRIEELRRKQSLRREIHHLQEDAAEFGLSFLEYMTYLNHLRLLEIQDQIEAFDEGYNLLDDIQNDLIDIDCKLSSIVNTLDEMSIEED